MQVILHCYSHCKCSPGSSSKVGINTVCTLCDHRTDQDCLAQHPLLCGIPVYKDRALAAADSCSIVPKVYSWQAVLGSCQTNTDQTSVLQALLMYFKTICQGVVIVAAHYSHANGNLALLAKGLDKVLLAWQQIAQHWRLVFLCRLFTSACWLCCSCWCCCACCAC